MKTINLKSKAGFEFLWKLVESIDFEVLEELLNDGIVLNTDDSHKFDEIMLIKSFRSFDHSQQRCVVDLFMLFNDNNAKRKAEISDELRLEPKTKSA